MSTIEGRICEDANPDGQCQADDPGVAGLTVTLDPAALHATYRQEEQTVVTGANGDYRFIDVEPGRHWLRLADPTRRWLVTSIELEVSTALYETAIVDVELFGPVKQLYLPLIVKER